MRFWQTLTRSGKAAWPLKILGFVLAFYLVFVLIAALAWLGFGRNAEEQVIDLAGDVTTIVGIVLVPVLVIGLIAVPLYRWSVGELVNVVERDPPEYKPDQWLGWWQSTHTVRKFVLVCVVIAALFAVLVWAFGG
jgi:hypothetical protein